MAIVNISRDYGINPSIVRVITTDDFATVFATGYVTAQQANIDRINGGPFQWAPTDYVLICYGIEPVYGTGGSFVFATLNSTFTTFIDESSPSVVTPQDIQEETFIYYNDTTGTNDNFIADLTPPVTDIVDGQIVVLAENATNTTGSPTVSVNGLAPTTIAIANNYPLLPGDIGGDSPSILIYNSNYSVFDLINPRSVYALTQAYVGSGGTLFTVSGGGSANVYTGSYSPAFANAIAPFQGMFLYLIIPVTNTAASTFNFNGTGAIDILTTLGNELTGGEMPSGMAALLFFNGTNWQLLNSAKAFVNINIQKFSATGTSTYTPTIGLQFNDVYLWGAGGGSGGAAGVTSQGAASGGASGAGFSKKTYNAAQIGSSATIFLGTPGAAGTTGNNPGGNATSSTFTPAGTGPVLTCHGGLGSSGSASTATSTSNLGAQQGGTATGGDINIEGTAGTPGLVINGATGLLLPGIGGAAGFSVPFINYSLSATSGTPAYGAGGCGQATTNSTSEPGQAGGAAFCYIVEYCAE